jgi:DNA mismatch repair ATPase MutS
VGAMTFESILFSRVADRNKAEGAVSSDFFGDLNLDQIVDAITKGRDEYDLKSFYWFALDEVDAIHYRHEVFQDLESATLNAHVRSFTQRMREMREYLTQASKLYYTLQKQSWSLDAVEIYGDAIRRFAADLSASSISSRAFIAFRDYLTDYATGEVFTSLMDETGALKLDLSKVRYSILAKDNAFSVNHYEAESDYSAEIAKTFDKFRQGETEDYKVAYRPSVEMNHIEAQILDFVAKLNPELFTRFADYRARHASFIEKTIAAFDREVHFYLAYLDHISKLTVTGLQFCFPRVSSTSKEVFAKEAFDLALAQKLTGGKTPIVRNDFCLNGEERIIVVSGPNQGGKTTFARMFGQLHYLASLGCPVAGREARLLLFDQLFTHFEREENAETLRGKLEDDLVRIHTILNRATTRSIIVLNEVFTSTTLQDEVFLSRKVMKALVERDLLCVWVTFVDDLATYDDHIVSMVGTVVPDNPALRTFKVVRQRADGLAYATAIAEKYNLTYERIKERIPL